MKPTIRTSFVESSWMTAGMRPFSLEKSISGVLPKGRRAGYGGAQKHETPPDPAGLREC